jgi:hypothetical protein
MADSFQKAVRSPDVSINSNPPVDTTQLGVDLEVDVSHLYFPISNLSLNLTRTSAGCTRYRIYLRFLVSPILPFLDSHSVTNLSMEELELPVT